MLNLHIIFVFLLSINTFSHAGSYCYKVLIWVHSFLCKEQFPDFPQNFLIFFFCLCVINVKFVYYLCLSSINQHILTGWYILLQNSYSGSQFMNSLTNITSRYSCSVCKEQFHGNVSNNFINIAMRFFINDNIL